MAANVCFEHGAWFTLALLTGTVGWLAWFHGGTDARQLQWAEWALGAGGLAGMVLAGITRRERKPPGMIRHSWFLAAVLVFVFLLVQCLNPSHALDAATRYLNPVDHLSWLPRSVDRATSLQFLSLFVCCMIGFGLARCFLPLDGWPGRLLLFAVIAMAAGLSLMVILQRITPRPFPVFPLTGRFVYENHFAAFANLILPLTICCGIDFHRRAQQENARSHPGYILYGLGLLIVVAVVYSRSRAGMAISLLLVGIILLYLLFGGRKRGRSGWKSLNKSQVIIALVLVVMFAAVGGLGRKPIAQELKTVANIGEEIQFRKTLYGSVVKMFNGRRVTGIGAGTFAASFPFYQDPDLPGFFRHAHCDPLELLVELGLLGSALALLLAVGLLFPIGLKKERNRRPRESVEWLRFAIALSLGGLLLHSLIDFPFHLPVIAFTAFVFAGMLHAQPPEKRRRRRNLS